MSDRNKAHFHWVFSWIYYIFPYAKPTYLEGPATTQLQYVQSSVLSHSLPSSQLILLVFFLVLRALGEYSRIRKQFVKLLLKNTKAGWNKKIIFLRALSSRGSFFFLFFLFSFLRQAVYSLQCFWWWLYLLDLSWGHLVHESNKKGTSY